MSTVHAVVDVLMSAPSVTPAADLFGTATSMGEKFKTAVLAIGGAAIAWMLLSKLFSKGITTTGAVLAIVTAICLFWLLNNVENKNLQAPLDDTVKELGAPAVPAFIDGGTVHVQVLERRAA